MTTTHNVELKEQILVKMMPPNSQSIPELSKSSGIPRSTLYAWRSEARNEGKVVPAKSSIPEKWNWKDKIAAVLETETMNQAERSAYCRQKGLYVEQLDRWRNSFSSVDEQTTMPSKNELAAERKINKQLQKELRRKDKALAEAAALLVLQKKAQAIWGDNGED